MLAVRPPCAAVAQVQGEIATDGLDRFRYVLHQPRVILVGFVVVVAVVPPVGPFLLPRACPSTLSFHRACICRRPSFLPYKAGCSALSDRTSTYCGMWY